MRTGKITIIECAWAKTNGSKWMVRGLRNSEGRPIRRFFKARDDTQDWLKERRPELRDHGRAAMALTDGQRLELVTARI